MFVAKTKVLISCTVTTQLICVFVFTYANNRFPNDAAHINLGVNTVSSGFEKVMTQLPMQLKRLARILKFWIYM